MLMNEDGLNRIIIIITGVGGRVYERMCSNNKNNSSEYYSAIFNLKHSSALILGGI